ncbi:MAG: insulinase family protein [Candidatus Methanomethylophilaceae archaeon]|nr:insulinase family protein [Candidatus Methanomethylophilaceae archaeon]
MSSRSIGVSETSGGIPVAVEAIQGSQSAGFMIAVATGSRDEHPGIFGLSHLLEHTVFRETKTRDSYQMAKEIEGAGGEINAFTGREMTAFYGITIKETADVAMDIVGDIVANPTISEKDTELEKKIVLQELSMIKNEPESYIHDLFESQLWRGHPLSQDEGGSEEVVEGLSFSDLRAYYDEKYRIPNLSVYAVGAVDLDSTVSWAEEALDGMSGGSRNPRSPPEAPASGYKFVKNDADHYQIAMGFPAYGASHKDRMAVSMLSAVLGSGTSSRLFQAVREEKALVYSVFSSVSQCSDASSLATYMSCTGSNVVEAMQTASAQFGKLLAEGLGKGELERSKRLVKGANVRAMESTENRLYRMGVNHVLNGCVESLEDRLARIDAVTEDDLMRVAEDVLRPGRMNTVVLGKGNKAVRGCDPESLSF